jgi:membrane protein YqaA with SNARE-associated domain
VLSWEASPYATAALFLLAFAESSFFPVPPDVLLMALALGKPRRAFFFALTASLGSVLGGLFGYYIGYELWYSGNEYSAVARFFFSYIPGFTVSGFETVRSLYQEHGFWIVFTAGFTPIPYKIFTILAGITHINLGVFLVASGIGRAGRFFLVSGLIYFWGEPIRDFIDRYFNKLSLLFVILLLAGFWLVGRLM